VAIALYQKRKTEFLSQLLPPIVNCFGDKSTAVQTVACQAICNILKTYGEAVLSNKLFEHIFDRVILLTASANTEVKDFANITDRAIKETVYKCLNTKNVTFKLNDFVELVCQKFEKSKDYDTPMVLIDWIEHLNSIPSVNIIKFMPRFILKFLRVIETTEQNLKVGGQ